MASGFSAAVVEENHVEAQGSYQPRFGGSAGLWHEKGI
jgi:hypothetical protein